MESQSDQNLGFIIQFLGFRQVLHSRMEYIPDFEFKTQITIVRQEFINKYARAIANRVMNHM